MLFEIGKSCEYRDVKPCEEAFKLTLTSDALSEKVNTWGINLDTIEDLTKFITENADEVLISPSIWDNKIPYIEIINYN